MLSITGIVFLAAATGTRRNPFFANALALSSGPGRPGSATAPPNYYHADLVSPLARLAARHATIGTPFPSTLSARELEPLDAIEPSNTVDNHVRAATFAGGCFWSLQLAYDRTPGVLATCVGYTGGHAAYPTYSDVCAETTGHTEACLVAYDPKAVTYERLAAVMFERIPDPTLVNRVGKDRGSQYRTGLFVHCEEEMAGARKAYDVENRMWRTSGREVTTEVTLTTANAEQGEGGVLFWPAEEGHQRYLAKEGSYGRPQSDAVGCTDEIRCYG